MLQEQAHGFIVAAGSDQRLRGHYCRPCHHLEPTFLELHGPWLLAHELSHTRQHDWLGPAYLPLHAILQAVSVVFYFIRPIAKFSPWHAYNPLERVLICVPIDVIVDGRPPEGELASNILREFGLVDQ
jgi:hypothetical protein